MESPDDASATEPPCRYDAFISYRHVEPDRRWAKWLHSALETYRVPATLAAQRGIERRARRVFRDEEELPASADLNQEIETALRESRFLIVVCSPRTPGSRWVQREIERFREMGRHDRILALLIEGEPADSFPAALREIRRRITDDRGTDREQIEQVEPLAADVRRARSERRSYLSRMAKLRLLACVLGCRFDDLRQRDQERRARRVAHLGLAAIGLACVMAGLTAFAFAQRRAAVANAERARQNAQRADSEARHAVAEKNLAELRLAEGLIAQGEALRQSQRWTEARSCFGQSREQFISLGRSPVEADVGLYALGLEAPPALLTFAGHGAAVRAVAVSPDGRTALSAGDDGTLKWWDLPCGREIRSLKGHSGHVLAVAFVATGMALSGSADGTLKLWDLAAGKVIHTLSGHVGAVNALAVSPDGRRALSGGRDFSVRLWDLETGKALRVFDAHAADVYCVAFSPDDRHALSGSADKTLILWDLDRTTPLRQMAGRGGPIMSAVFTPDGNAALASNGDSTLTLWDVRTGKEIHTFAGHSSTVLGVAVSSDGARALSASFDKTLKLWDLSGGPAVMTLADGGPVTSVAFAPDGPTAISGSEDHTVKLWSVGADNRPLAFLGHRGAVTAVAFSRDGRTVLTGGWDKTIRLWDAATGRQLCSCTGPSEVTGVALLPDGRRAVSVGTDKLVRLWDLPSGTLVQTFAGHTGPLQCVAISPGGTTALSAGWDQTANLFDLATGRLVRTLHDAKGAVNCVAFTPDGNGALTGGVDGVLKLWDLRDGSIRRSFAGHVLYIFALAISPDGKTALSGGYDRTVKWWDLSSGKELHTFTGHTDVVHGVAFSPGGRLAASVAADHTLRLWDLYAGKDLHTFTASGPKSGGGILPLADDGSLNCVGFSPDGGAVLTGGRDGIARLWDFGKMDRCVDQARAAAAAQAALARNRDDPAALQALGRWYVLRRINAWAIELLEEARASGATIDPLVLARCYWALSDETPSSGTLTRAGCMAAARREFGSALAAARTEGERSYLKLCLSATERATTQPTTQAAQAMRLTDQDLWIGRSNPVEYDTDWHDIFHGWMDELAIFRRALSSQEVERMYQAGKP